MTADQFSYWLQGYLEISGAKTLDERQLKIVQDHLKLVFQKVTPTYQIYPGSSLIGSQQPYTLGQSTLAIY